MLSDVLLILDNYNVFDFLEKEKTLLLLKEIVKVGCRYDCNDSEILGY